MLFFPLEQLLEKETSLKKAKNLIRPGLEPETCSVVRIDVLITKLMASTYLLRVRQT
jgi:hypothetical protein